MIQINPLKSYIDGGVRAALTIPPSASLVFDLPGKAIWVKGVKLKGTDHTYIFNHDNYITLTNTPDKNNPESEDIKIGVNITTLKNVIDTTYNGGTLALLQEGLNTEERTWLAKILHNYINDVLPITKNLKINGTNYAIYTTENSLPLFFVPISLGTTGQILACTSSGLIWVDLIQNTDYRVSLSSATSNSDYRIILKQGADNNPETDFVRFSEYLTFNPYTKTLKINNIKVVTATDIYVGATSTANAIAGLVPTATSEQLNYYLRGDGAWVNIATEMAAANTWRPIKVGNTDALGSGTNTGTLSFIAGTGIALSWDATNKRIIITNSSPDVNHNTDENVRQVPKTDNVNRPLMMINGSTSAGEQINTSMFSTGIYANASTKMITANGFIKAGSSDNYVLLGGGNHKALSDFAISYHNHYRIKLSDDRAKYPGQLTGNDTMSTFGGFMQNSILGISNFGNYSDVLVIRSYIDSSGGNDNAIIFNKNTRGVWHTQFGFGSTTSWGTPYLFLDSNNFNKYTPTLTGTGASGIWGINITGSSASCTGNAATSTLTFGLLGNGYTSGNSNIIRPFWNTKSDNRWYLQSADLAYLCRVEYATSSGNADTLDGNHASAFATALHTHNIYAANENYRGFTKSGRLPISGFYQSDESESGGNAPWTSWMHLINCLHSNTSNNYALLIAASFFDNNTFKIRVTENSVNNAWRDIIHSGNIGSLTVANAYHLRINSADTWSTWYWSGQGGLPTWLWGSNDGVNMYVWNPSNFSVNYASSAGNADTVDGYHASSLWRSDGATWNPSANIQLNASANNQEWSFDIYRNGYTGCYWHVWDTSLSTMLKVNADNGKVYAPYNFVGNLEGNASSATYLNVQYCRDDNYPSNKGLWNTIKNGTTNPITNRVRFYTIYGSSGNLGAPETYGELLEICSYNSNHWQPLLWFGAGTGGRLYYRNKDYNNNSWGAWRTVAWTSDIPIVTNYYWANIKVSSSSSTTTYPTFGSLSVVNDSCNNSIDALAYFQHRSNNDWTVKIDSGSYDYGLYINTSGNYALSVGPGVSRFRGSVIVGADATPSYTLDVRGTTRSTDRIYANEWIQFDNWTGLYSPNNGAHFYPNNTTSYGQWQLRGNRNGYSGIHFGDSTHYMTIMDSGTHKGLYSEGWGNWILYFNLDSKRLGLRTSSLTGYAVTCDGDFYCRSGWLRTEGATGWYNESYGGGWYMTDTSWIRSYREKSVYIGSGIFYNLRNAYFACDSGYNVGIGTASPTEKLHIVGDRIYWTNGDATLKIYGVETCCGNENVAFLSTFDGLDPLSSSYVTDYRTRSAILLLPRGGNVGINISHDPSYPLTVGGNVAATHFYENSDIRFKTNFSSIDISINQLSEIPLFDFDWIDNNTIRNSGTSALAVLLILPNLVSGTDKLTLDYGVLGTIAGITACKELVTLKSELQELKEKVKLLEDKLRKYENTL